MPYCECPQTAFRSKVLFHRYLHFPYRYPFIAAARLHPAVTFHGRRAPSHGHVAVLGELGRFPVAHTATLAICRFWNRLVAMPDTRLTKQAFLENCALATRPGRSKTSSACWAAQVCSFLHFMSPIVDGVPQRIDTSVVSAHLQRRTFDAVNGSDLRKVREWLGVRGPVNGDNYQLAGYLQAVASKTGRRRLLAVSTVPDGQSHAGGGNREVAASAAGRAAVSAV